ncbi:hypothetical protein NQ318_022373, partial [Aromia moschata]
ETYRFLKAEEFIDKNASYFKEKELHLTSNILTIGKVVHTLDEIFLEPLLSNTKRIGFMERC